MNKQIGKEFILVCTNLKNGSWKEFIATRLERRIIFSFGLTIFLVAGIVILTSAASVAYGQDR